MIPELDDQGYLPPGIHRASIDELAERFGTQFGTAQRRIAVFALAVGFGTLRGRAEIHR